MQDQMMGAVATCVDHRLEEWNSAAHVALLCWLGVGPAVLHMNLLKGTCAGLNQARPWQLRVSLSHAGRQHWLLALLRLLYSALLL